MKKSSHSASLALACIGAILWSTILVKSFFTAITYDEAFTFLYSVLPIKGLGDSDHPINMALIFPLDRILTFLTTIFGQDVLRFGKIFSLNVANNHPLNTALICLTTILGQDVFLIRLPNVLAGLLYLISAAHLSRKTKYPVMSMAILCVNPYLLEFFSLARGYGLASCLVFIALINYYFSDRARTSTLLAIIALAAASLAFYPVAIISLCFFIAICIEMWRKGRWAEMFLYSALTGAGMAFPLWAIMKVSRPGALVYGYTGSWLPGKLFLGLIAPLFSLYSLQMALIVSLLVFVPFLAWQLLSARTRSLFAVFVSSIFLFYAVAMIAGRPLPIGRLLIPFVPVLLLASVSAWDDVGCFFVYRHITWVTGAIISVLVINMAFSYKFNDTADWHSNKVDPSVIYQRFAVDGRCLDAANFDPPDAYYRRRAAEDNGIRCQ